MPFEQVEFRRQPLKNRVRHTRGGQLPGDEAHGLLGQGADPAPQHMGQQLVSQAKSQIGFPRRQPFPDPGLQGDEVGELLLFIHIGRPSQDNHAAKGVQGGQGLLPGLHHLVGYPPLCKRRQQVLSGALPIQVLHD